VQARHRWPSRWDWRWALKPALPKIGWFGSGESGGTNAQLHVVALRGI